MKQSLLPLLLISITTVTWAMPPKESIFYPDNHYHLYMWGYYNHLENAESVAKTCFESIIENQGSIYAYAGYIQHLFQVGNYKKIVELIPQMQESLKKQLDVQLIFVKALELVGNYAQADQFIISLYNTNKAQPDIAYGTALAFVRQKQPTKALTIIQEYLQESPERHNHFLFHFLSAQLYLGLNKPDMAKTHIQKALTLNPHFEQGWLLSGLINELTGNIEQAISGYQQFLTLTNENPHVEQQIAELLLMQKQKKSESSIKKTFDNALLLYQKKQYKEALALLEQSLQENMHYPPAQLLKIELLCLINEHRKAIDTLAQLIKKEPDNELWFRALYLLFKAGTQQEYILTLLKQIEKEFPQALQPILYLADICLKKQQYQPAIVYLKKIIAKNQPTAIMEKAWYQLAAIYFHAHDTAATQQIIEEGIKKNVSFIPFLNLAAYFYATKGNNLVKAQQLIETVLHNHPNNPHYLDTQALIWYKQKQYDKAATLLAELQRQQPDDFFIQKHLSKTWYKQGNIQQAVNLLNQALKNSPSYEKEKTEKIVSQWHTQIKPKP